MFSLDEIFNECTRRTMTALGGGKKEDRVNERWGEREKKGVDRVKGRREEGGKEKMGGRAGGGGNGMVKRRKGREGGGGGRGSVSSVLNRDVKQFGKKHLFDGEEDTCWNSDQGLPQWVHVELTQLSNVEEIKIRFQGGFAGKECWVESHDCEGTPTKIMDFYPEDINSLQISF
ncbi:hypothetical protein FSP39_015113 [Pinctada imbricata]|uniref:Nuclear receptor 2C2-associated protein n=1 Tax=Pinctada imbricata TaxID=66713 RepID=A0AA89C178_PINIB|nr:hypothetical protein FSP39_015113 [Pinctada imbricata]